MGVSWSFLHNLSGFFVFVYFCTACYIRYKECSVCESVKFCWLIIFNWIHRFPSELACNLGDCFFVRASAGCSWTCSWSSNRHRSRWVPWGNRRVLSSSYACYRNNRLVEGTRSKHSSTLLCLHLHMQPATTVRRRRCLSSVAWL